MKTEAQTLLDISLPRRVEGDWQDLKLKKIAQSPSYSLKDN